MGRRISKKKWKRRELQEKKSRKPWIELLPENDPRRRRAEEKAGIKKEKEYIPPTVQEKRFQRVISDIDGIITSVIKEKGYEMQREVKKELGKMGLEETPESIRIFLSDKMTKNIAERFGIKNKNLKERLGKIIEKHLP